MSTISPKLLARLSVNTTDAYVTWFCPIDSLLSNMYGVMPLAFSANLIWTEVRDHFLQKFSTLAFWQQLWFSVDPLTLMTRGQTIMATFITYLYHSRICPGYEWSVVPHFGRHGERSGCFLVLCWPHGQSGRYSPHTTGLFCRQLYCISKNKINIL